VLTDASARLRDRAGAGLAVSTELLSGTVSGTIVGHASGAEIAVVERRDAGTLERLLTLSVSSRVAAHADIPVAVVPRTWEPSADRIDVTVGVEDAADADVARSQVEAAAEYAALAGAPLTMLHAIWLAEPYQQVVHLDHTRDVWVQQATDALRAATASFPASGGSAPVVDIRWARPADSLVAASQRSAALVLNRRAGHARTHLGPITRAVLQHAACPVLLVDRR
jgi:nucleotide-binding universal stress UspA family protein